ncbi:aquaporin, partial [Streptomyces sp. URMC 123]|uniref:aquaporin n=1 Tax=Streptomyces sp. URMC 123 TaxID=3423403 RepID=UPI003F1ACF32
MTILEYLINVGMWFTVITTVRWTVAPDAPLSGVLTGQRFLIFMGVLFGLLNYVIVEFSFRRQTAGHMNPSVTVGLWLLGYFPARNVAPFIAAQLLGSLTGFGLGRLVWGEVVATLGYAKIAPNEGWGVAQVYGTELAGQCAILVIVAALMLRPRLTKFVPATVGLCIGLVMIFLGSWSGGVQNPARQFGPALLSGNFDLLWVYLTAPVVGVALSALLAVALRPPVAAGPVEGAGTAAEAVEAVEPAGLPVATAAPVVVEPAIGWDGTDGWHGASGWDDPAGAGGAGATPYPSASASDAPEFPPAPEDPAFPAVPDAAEFTPVSRAPEFPPAPEAPEFPPGREVFGFPAGPEAPDVPPADGAAGALSVLIGVG